MFTSLSALIFFAAGASVCGGILMMLFPGAVKRWSDSKYESQFRVRPSPPESIRLRSEGSFRALGVGLLVVAMLLAYYGYMVR